MGFVHHMPLIFFIAFLCQLCGNSHSVPPSNLEMQSFTNRVYQQMIGARISAQNADYICFTLTGEIPACSPTHVDACKAGIFSKGDSKIITITRDDTTVTAVACSREVCIVGQPLRISGHFHRGELGGGVTCWACPPPPLDEV